MKRIPSLPHYGSAGISEVSMSAIADRALSMARPEAPASTRAWVPLACGLWVLAIVALGALGVYSAWPIRCGFLAGLMNGSLLAVIAVATASERFQAGATGLLGGLSLSALRSDGSMVWKVMQSLHTFIDNVFRAMGIELDERLHRAVEQEA